ncbi:MAG: hypothetical protein U0350_38535 [Caldilineaceae bacterium]
MDGLSATTTLSIYPAYPLVIMLFGSLQLTVQGKPPVDFRSNKVRALLAYLLLAQAKPIARATLTDLLWPGYTSNSARANLRQVLYNLREVLNPHDLLQSNYQSIQLQLDPMRLWCDALAFDALLDACQNHRHAAITACPECQARLQQALALYKGPLLEQLPAVDSPPFNTWLRDQQARYAEHFARIVALLGNGGAVSNHPPMEGKDESHAPAVRQTIPHNLPVQFTSFIGREASIAQLKTWLTGAAEPSTPTLPHLITLTGTGGVGKTRLSLQVAAEVLPAFHDGVWLIELAPLTDPALLPTMVATVLGVRAEADRPLLTTLCEWLQGKQLLLILDNCEHLVADCARFADALLRASDTLRILATSREALGIMGELRYEVPALAFPTATLAPLPSAALMQYEAVRLFSERATLVQPAFHITAANAQAIAELCQRLDGIPLALELAAARVKALPIATITARLDDRFRLLVHGNRATLPRHQTLRALIDWSYDLLGASERVLLRRLAVFAGGWTLEAAEAVCTDPETAGADAADGAKLAPADILDCLTQLVEKSLVVFDEQSGAPRYRLLETIHQYAGEKLQAAQEEETLRTRHLQFFLALAERSETALLDGAQRTPWLRRLTAEHDNLQAALAWSCEREPALASRLAGLLRWYWDFSDQLILAESWYQRVLALYQPTPATHARALALLGMGLITADLHAKKAGRPFLEESIRAWQTVHDPAKLSETFTWLLYVMLFPSEAEAVCRLCAEQEAFLRSNSTPYIFVHFLNYWGRALSLGQPDFATAQRLHEEALRIGQQTQDPLILGKTSQYLGHLAMQQGDYATAQRHYWEALAWRRQAGTQWLVGIALYNAADSFTLHGDHAGAYSLYLEALALGRTLGMQHNVAYLLARLGMLATQQGDADGAAAYWAESIAFYQTRGIRDGVGHIVICAAERYQQQGQPTLAVRLVAVKRLTITHFLLNDILIERTLTTVRTQLTAADFAAAWAAGEQMTLDEALALALKAI